MKSNEAIPLWGAILLIILFFLAALGGCGYDRMKQSALEGYVQYFIADEDREDTEVALIFEDFKSWFLYQDAILAGNPTPQRLEVLKAERTAKIQDWRLWVDVLVQQGRMSKKLASRLSVNLVLLGANEPALSSFGAIAGEGIDQIGAKIRHSQAKDKLDKMRENGNGETKP